jgi:hypothetical protein
VGKAVVAQGTEVAVVEVGLFVAVTISAEVAKGPLLALGQVDEVH